MSSVMPPVTRLAPGLPEAGDPRASRQRFQARLSPPGNGHGGDAAAAVILGKKDLPALIEGPEIRLPGEGPGNGFLCDPVALAGKLAVQVVEEGVPGPVEEQDIMRNSYYNAGLHAAAPPFPL